MSNSIILTNEDDNFATNYQYVNPTGTIVCFAGQSLPPGWFLCDGSEISKLEYSKLFSVIGNTYGTPANDSNFVLPDLRQRMPLCRSSSNNLGDTSGNSNITLSINQLPLHNHTGTTDISGSHNHTASDSGHSHLYDDAYFAENQVGGPNNVFGTSASTDNDNTYRYRPTPTTNTGYAAITVANNGAHTHRFTTDATGNGSSINIMNPYLVLNYLIKY